jgi:H+/gluconate symporter-like permease
MYDGEHAMAGYLCCTIGSDSVRFAIAVRGAVSIPVFADIGYMA